MGNEDIITLISSVKNITTQMICDDKFIIACFGVVGMCAGQYITGYLPENLSLDRKGLKLMGGAGGLAIAVLIARYCLKYPKMQTVLTELIDESEADDTAEGAQTN